MSVRRIARGAATLAGGLLIGGCWMLIGESFDGYSTDAGVTVMEGGMHASIDGKADRRPGTAGPPAIDDCSPSFFVANAVTYPERSPGACEIPGACATVSNSETYDGGAILLDTDKDCYGGADSGLPYCLVLATSVHIREKTRVEVFGSRPLVVVSVHDFTIDDRGVLNAAGEDQGGTGYADGLRGGGPGDHAAGSSSSRGGGGGNAEPGGSPCGQQAGPPIELEAGLVAGGHGGALLSPAPLMATTRCPTGGLGGGAVQIVSLCGTIIIGGVVDVAGGAGGGGQVRSSTGGSDDVCPNGAGGGAGGTVWLQASQPVVFQASTGGHVRLSGGGGGGGACKDSTASPWLPGGGGNNADFSAPATPGAGGACSGGSFGGAGGAGGSFDTAPGAGESPTPVSPGQGRCGGGGGARGRLVLQAPQDGGCGDIFNFHDGKCIPVP
jgi:hypothetical protein